MMPNGISGPGGLTRTGPKLALLATSLGEGQLQTQIPIALWVTSREVLAKGVYPRRKSEVVSPRRLVLRTAFFFWQLLQLSWCQKASFFFAFPLDPTSQAERKVMMYGQLKSFNYPPRLRRAQWRGHFSDFAGKLRELQGVKLNWLQGSVLIATGWAYTRAYAKILPTLGMSEECMKE